VGCWALKVNARDRVGGLVFSYVEELRPRLLVLGAGRTHAVKSTVVG